MNPNDAQDRLSAMLAPLPFDDTLFPPTSRYHGLGTAVLDPDPDSPAGLSKVTRTDATVAPGHVMTKEST